jgi:prepilin-type N-terminal cleavage/methylation domain-containing protein
MQATSRPTHTCTARFARAPRRCRHQDGFSLIEMAVVLVVLGLITWTVSSAYDNTGPVRDRAIAVQTGEALREALRAFALQNGRLPCPDTIGNGDENLTPAGVCAEVAAAGWLPYHALGLDIPQASMRASYAVHRNPSAPGGDADLAVRTERTGDLPGAPDYRNVRDLIAGLRNATGEPANADMASITGDGAASGAINCATNVRSEPAFFLIFPLSDRDADGKRLDSVHAAPALSNLLCAYAPGTPLTLDHDDVVIAESNASLAGWLGARVP